MKYFSKEVQIALVAVVGIVILFFGLKFLKGLSLVSNDNVYYALFDDVSGLSSSSPVYANGFKVGTVHDVQFDYANQRHNVVTLDLDKQFQLPGGTTASIESDMMGNVKLVLKLPDAASGKLAPGDTITGGKLLGLLDKAGDMVPVVEKMLPKLDSIMASLNALLADPAISHSLHNVDRITSDLTVTTQQLNQLMAQVNRNVPGMMGKANGVLDNAGKLTKNLSDIDVAGTMAKVDATLANVQQLTDKLNSNEGTLGLLMRDPQLYNNLTSTMGHADSLLIDLKSHPKRYVHFSLFGRKDK